MAKRRKKLPTRRESRKPPGLRAAKPVGFEKHPRYGDIPLVPEDFIDEHGRVHLLHVYDPAFEPPLPRGAVRGDITRQKYGLGTPQYYYIDIRRDCVQCREPFVFAAAEQKHWYETLGFHMESKAIRCPGCRRQRRNAAALNTALSSAKDDLRKNPGDPLAHLAVATATVALRQKLGRGNIQQAIAAARKAKRLDPTLVDAIYWDAVCQEQACRPVQAEELYERFIKVAAINRRSASLVRKAKARLEDLRS